MSDYRERTCTKCGSLLHHESKCVAAEHAAARTDDPTGHQEPYPQCRPVEQYTTPARQARTDELAMVRAEVDRTARVVRALSAAVNNTGYSGAECVRLLIWEVEKLSKLCIRQVALEDAAAKTTGTATIEGKEQD